MITSGLLLAALLAGPLAPLHAAPLDPAPNPAPAADALQPGDPVPPLEHVKWIRGEPVGAFEQGTVYVLDLFGIWCSACRARMERWNELSAEHAGEVVFIAMGIVPKRSATSIEDWADAHDEEIGFRLCEDVDDQTSSLLLDATGRETWHNTIIIDAEGKLAWIGSPDGMDEILEEVLAGKFNGRRYAKELARLSEAAQDSFYLYSMYNNSLRDKNYDRAAEIAREIADLHEDFSGALVDEYECYLRAGNKSKAKALGRRLVRRGIKENPFALRNLSWTIVDPKARFDPDLRDLKLAGQAAARATDLFQHEDPDLMINQAWIAIHSDDTGRAREILKTARALVEDDKQVAKKLRKAEKAAGLEE